MFRVHTYIVSYNICIVYSANYIRCVKEKIMILFLVLQDIFLLYLQKENYIFVLKEEKIKLI